MALISELLVQFLPAIAAAVLAAFATVRLSLRQFRSQWWWERKADTYSRIIDELASLRMCLDEWFRDATHEVRLSDERKADIGQQYRQARNSVERLSNIGAFTISHDAASAIKDLLTHLEQRTPDRDWVRDLDAHAAAVARAIERMKTAARVDLAAI